MTDVSTSYVASFQAYNTETNILVARFESINNTNKQAKSRNKIPVSMDEELFIVIFFKGRFDIVRVSSREVRVEKSVRGLLFF